jgi:hypothetical protein
MTTTTLTTELPKELERDPAWRAVLYLLEAAFPNEPRVWKYVERWSIDFDRMLNEGSGRVENESSLRLLLPFLTPTRK